MNLQEQIDTQTEKLELLARKRDFMLRRNIDQSDQQFRLLVQEICSAGEELARLQYQQWQQENSAA